MTQIPKPPVLSSFPTLQLHLGRKETKWWIDSWPMYISWYIWCAHGPGDLGPTCLPSWSPDAKLVSVYLMLAIIRTRKLHGTYNKKSQVRSMAFLPPARKGNQKHYCTLTGIQRSVVLEDLGQLSPLCSLVIPWSRVVFSHTLLNWYLSETLSVSGVLPLCKLLFSSTHTCECYLPCFPRLTVPSTLFRERSWFYLVPPSCAI